MMWSFLYITQGVFPLEDQFHLIAPDHGQAYDPVSRWKQSTEQSIMKGIKMLSIW